jgi:hypothetical protein
MWQLLRDAGHDHACTIASGLRELSFVQAVGRPLNEELDGRNGQSDGDLWTPHAR